MKYITKIIEHDGLPIIIISDEMVKESDIHIGNEYEISEDKESSGIFVQFK